MVEVEPLKVDRRRKEKSKECKLYNVQQSDVVDDDNENPGNSGSSKKCMILRISNPHLEDET